MLREREDRHSLIYLPFMTSGQETERVNFYNRTGPTASTHLRTNKASVTARAATTLNMMSIATKEQ